MGRKPSAPIAFAFMLHGRNVLSASLYVIALVAVGCGSQTASQSEASRTTLALTHEVKGSISVKGRPALSLQVGEPCIGESGYDDIRPGITVTVKDETGKILATSLLGMGGIASPPTTSRYDYSPSAPCQFPFTLHAVPDAMFYAFEVGGRAQVVFNRQDLEAKGWNVDLTLG